MSEFIHLIDGAMHRLGLSGHTGPIIVALSGGADSVALLSALSALGYRCVAAHCDFHLRGDESERDRRHAEATAKALGADYEEIHFDVNEYRRVHRVSMEMACRELRYDWFRRLSDRCGGAPVAVAHHSDDNAETMFLNLFRGTGISGLTGMRQRNGIIIRPMLDATRAQIESYLDDAGIGYVVDSSNLENDVKRNRIRNVIMPEICRQFPDAKSGISATMDNLERTDALYRELLHGHAADFLLDGERAIDLKALVAEIGEASTMLYEMIRDKGFNYTQAANIISAHHSGTSSGRVFHADGWRAVLDRGILHLREAECDDGAQTSYRLDLTCDGIQPPGIEVSRIGRDELKFDRTGLTLFLDAEVLEGEPEFEVRRWREGDRMAPFGMKGTRLLSDIFSDAKLSVDDKRKVWLLTRNGLILWAVGMRTSRHFAVTDHTASIIRLRYSPVR